MHCSTMYFWTLFSIPANYSTTINRNIGGTLNLAVWRLARKPPNLMYRQYYCKRADRIFNTWHIIISPSSSNCATNTATFL